jgi:DNA repair photolyase
MSNLYDFIEKGEWDGKFRTVECSRALSPSGIPGLDFVVNPYGGCNHGCVYCYAPEVTHSEWKDWRVVRVRSNMATRLAKELKNIDSHAVIGLGSSTDPYQYAESRFQITRDCLTVLKRFGSTVHIITKSDLVTRDIDLLSEMDCTVGITITGLDERMSKIAEPGAPMPEKRLAALKELVDAGIRAYVMAEPMMSHIEGHEAEFVDAIASTGTKRMEVGPVGYRPELRARMERMHLRSASVMSIERIKQLAKAKGFAVNDPF